MSLLLRAATIVDPASPLHMQQSDLFIKEGKIESIGENLSVSADAELSSDNLHVSAGWFDTFADFCDPGHEYQEDLESGTAAAAAGGFTNACVIPATSPVLHSKSEIEYIRKKTATDAVAVWPLGAVSRNLEGTDLTEMYDMKRAGALAFTEGKKPVWHTGLLLRALRYVKPFEGVIINLPRERELAGKTGVHEGAVSTRMGMPGIPSLAETLMVQRDIELARYTESHIHFAMLSTAAAVQLVRAAQKDGVKVTAGVAAYQLLLNDDAIAGFDPLYKTNPPLRSEQDRLALIEGVKDGTLGLVCSNHIPKHEDAKKLEFEYADAGINGLESSFAVMNTALAEQVPLARRIALLTEGPRKIFGLDSPQIKEGEPADLTFFDPEKSSTLSLRDMKSRARNNPFVDQPLKGTVLGIAHRGQVLLR